MPFSPRLAYEPLAVQEGHALRALQELLEYVLAASPFYKKHYSSLRQDVRGIKNFTEFRLLPFTDKRDIQAYNWDFLCVPRGAIREYTATSGTMGKPVTVALTKADLTRLAYNERQSFICADGSQGDIYQLALTLDRQFMAGMAYYSGIQELGATAIRTGPGLPQMQWETIHRLQANSLVVVPSFLLAMTAYATLHGIDPESSTIKKAVCIGESIRRADFSLSALGRQISSEWPAVRLYNTYAATELQTAFTECRAGKGGHHQPDLIIVEIIDDNGTPVEDGTPGEIVVTTLGIEAMPLLRYRTGDIATLHAEPCTCGRLSKRLGPVIGRKGQMIKYRGTTLYPPAIFDTLNEATCISEYVVEVYTGAQDTDEVRLHVHTSLPVDECDNRLRALLQSGLRIIPQLQYHTGVEMQAMMMPPGSRKQVKFIDNRRVM